WILRSGSALHADHRFAPSPEPVPIEIVPKQGTAFDARAIDAFYLLSRSNLRAIELLSLNPMETVADSDVASSGDVLTSRGHL
ncbi:MAG: hypothetical protein KAV00_15870, partial [Phycisphaerae bacterium]|nr:hypothetical protein [Phycisphaerae bacterium]